MLSIIIPTYKEPYLVKTLQGLLDNTMGEFEILVNVDDAKMPEIVEDKRITYLHDGKKGMRGGTNACLKIAKGDYIMKTDAHCLFANGYDLVMIQEMKENWLMIPRRYPLHADEWRVDTRMPVKDYHYLSWPHLKSHYGSGLYPQEWQERTQQRLLNPNYIIDDTMTFQGSCWLANKKYFMEHVGYLNDSEDAYTSFTGEPLEIGLKYWLGGGEVKVNKKTWYAHLFKNKHFYERFESTRQYKKELKAKGSNEWAAKHWLRNEEPNMIHPFSWLLEKFWPVPTWPEDRMEWKT